MSESDPNVRPVATLWLLERAESLLESSEVGVIGEASRSALVEEARRSIGQAQDQVDAAVGVLVELAKTLVWAGAHDDDLANLVFAVDLLHDGSRG